MPDPHRGAICGPVQALARQEYKVAQTLGIPGLAQHGQARQVKGTLVVALHDLVKAHA